MTTPAPLALKRRQCAEGLDANPGSVPHYPHVWDSKYGPRWCRGWLPRFQAVRGGVQYARGGCGDLGCTDCAAEWGRPARPPDPQPTD